ncbi:unnamed protein product [Rotaria socialis]
MYGQNCNLVTQDGQFFDITHTFKIGSSTYHILGLRQDRPTYRNTYYIFNCVDDQHESTNESLTKTSFFKRPTTASEQQTRRPKHRSHTAHRTSTLPINNSTTNKIKRTNSIGSDGRARTESPKRVDIDTTNFRETFRKAMRFERKMLVASLRKEMNVKKRTLVRTIRKEQEVIVQATTEASNKEEIFRLLEEQKNSLGIAFESYVNTTNASIDTLKQILVETLDAHHNVSQSTEQHQFTLIQTIEQEIQKLILKNEDILKSTSSETNAMNKLQNNLTQKIENIFLAKKRDDDLGFNHLFSEQKQALVNAVAQQQQAVSLDLIKQTMVDAIQEQQALPKKSNSNIEHIKKSIDNSTTNITGQQKSINIGTIADSNLPNLSRTKSVQHSRSHDQSSSKSTVKKLPDEDLFKVSIRAPEPAHLFAKLTIGDKEYSRRLHTLCQRDVNENDVFNCYVAPPETNGPYEVTIYAKTNNETAYRAAICIRLPGLNLSQSITFPLIHQSFEQYQCILIEPLRRLLRQNEHVLIHMIVPNAQVVKIRNGDENIAVDMNEYKNDVVKKKIRVRGDVSVIGCWDKKVDSTICVFNMIR